MTAVVKHYLLFILSLLCSVRIISTMLEMMAASITADKARMTSQILTVAANSAPWWSFLSRLWGSLTVVQWAAVVAAAVLTLGAIFEYWVKIKLLTVLALKYLLGKSTPFDRCIFRKLFMHSLGPILVVAGIAGEVIFEGRAFILEDRQEEQAQKIVGSLQDKVAMLSSRADALKTRLDAASTRLGTLEQDTTSAKDELSRLRESIKPRHLTKDQKEKIRKALIESGYQPTGPIPISVYLGAEDGTIFAQDIKDAIESAPGWHAPVSLSGLGGDEQGMAILVAVPPSPQFVPLWVGILQRAFHAAGRDIDVEVSPNVKPHEAIVAIAPKKHE
jgi:hypothetical protein